MLHKKKVYTYVLTILLSVLFLMLPALAYSDIVLKKGMQGDAVLNLQRDLNSIGFMSINPTGYFGDITEDAVIKFQKEYNLLVDGIAGAQTLEKLKSVLEKKVADTESDGNTDLALLKKGMQGEEVTLLQQNLKKLGLFSMEPTGYFGDVTYTAVVNFQRAHGLTPDGIAGINTSNKINFLLGKRTLKKEMTGSDVMLLQSDLHKLGFFNANPTGYFGDITETAVKDLQEKNGLEVTGIVDLLTFAKIDSLLCNKSNGIKIVIDPGHGGNDVGTFRGDVYESKVVLDISKRLKTYLEADGYEVTFTRDRDVDLTDYATVSGNWEKRDLNGRVNIINNNRADLFVSIHINSLPEHPSVSGSIVFYNAASPRSKTLAQNIQKELNEIAVSNFNRQSNSIKNAEFYILKHTDMPGVLVETAFITNPNEHELLKTEAFRDQIAKAIAAGIRNTMN